MRIWKRTESECTLTLLALVVRRVRYSYDSFTFVNKARIPTTKAIEEARLQTFGEDWWPHDGDDHGANSRKVWYSVLCHCFSLIRRCGALKMAQAGFVYTPQSAGDDTVTCLYCNLALGGWDKDDDPMCVSSSASVLFAFRLQPPTYPAFQP